MSQFNTLTIKEIRKETVDAVSLLFTIPSKMQQAYSFIAGQYVIIKATIAGKELRRSYSICSSPNTNELRIAVKAVKNGTFSVHAVNNLKEGDVLKVSTPEGRFTLETNPNNSKNYIAFVAGSGITPVFSMLKAVLENEPESHFYLVFGNKKPATTIFKDALEKLAAQNKQLHIGSVYSQTEEKNALFGRIDKSSTNYFIKNLWKDIAFKSAYLCGPEQMITIVSETLQNNNFNKKNIHFELFSSDDSLKENTSTSQALFTGQTKVTVVVDDETFTFKTDSKKNLLESVLKEGIDAPFSCQGGICSSCIAKVTKGTAIMEKNTILSDTEVAEGLILTCQAHPTTDEIVIDFDEA